MQNLPTIHFFIAIVNWLKLANYSVFLFSVKLRWRAKSMLMMMFKAPVDLDIISRLACLSINERHRGVICGIMDTYRLRHWPSHEMMTTMIGERYIHGWTLTLLWFEMNWSVIRFAWSRLLWNGAFQLNCQNIIGASNSHVQRSKSFQTQLQLKIIFPL